MCPKKLAALALAALLAAAPALAQSPIAPPSWKRYSDKLYLSFERAIGTTTEHLVKLDYALTQRVSLRGQTGTTSGVGLFYRYSWD